MVAVAAVAALATRGKTTRSADGSKQAEAASEVPSSSKSLRHLHSAPHTPGRASAPPSPARMATKSTSSRDSAAVTSASAATPLSTVTSTASAAKGTVEGCLTPTSRRAATSSPLPSELLDVSQAAPQEAVSTLATEILPAPPALPHDPNYPPLNPEAVLPPLLPFAGTSAVPLGNRSGKDALVNGQVASAAPAPVQPSMIPQPSAQEKKRKQQVYSLATPQGYEGQMPWALYAIVSGRPEALDRKEGKGKRKRANSRAGKATNGGRTSRSATPSTILSVTGQTSVDVPGDGRSGTSVSIRAAPSGADDDLAVSRADASAAELAEGTGWVAGRKPGQEEAAAVVTSPSTGLGATVPPSPLASDDTGGRGRGTPSTPSRAVAGGRGRGTPSTPSRAVELVSSDAKGAPLPATAQSDGQISNRGSCQASRLDLLPNTSTSTPGALEGVTADNRVQVQGVASPTNEGSSQKDALGRKPEKTAPATQTRLNSKTAKTPSLPLAVGEEVSTASRASSLSRTEGSDAGDEVASNGAGSSIPPAEQTGSSRNTFAMSSPSTSASLTAARPTRAAVAKVAARGSYYDAAAYELQSPLQAALVKSTWTTHRSTSVNRRVNGSSSRGAATSSSSAMGTPTPTGKTVNGKGKEKEMEGSAGRKGEGDEAPLNEDYCSTCTGTGHFICCDSCPRSFHFACVNPPLDINEVPLDDDSEWHCRACSAQRRVTSTGAQKKSSLKHERKTAKGGRFFAHLIDHVDTQNPSIFSLSPDIKSYFKNVGSSAYDGSYQDIGRQRVIKADRKGIIDERDPYRLKDAKGREILCYQCGQSALPKDFNPRKDSNKTPDSSWQRLVSCDFCSLHWHLDCLNPPLSAVPSSFRKWRCPCHIEDLLVKTRTAKASTQLQIVDLPVPTLFNTGYGPGKIYRPRVLNSGVIDIVPDPTDTYFTSASSSDTSGRSLQPGWLNGGRADLPPLADAEIPGGGIRRVKFRLPEKVVRTDWWMKVLHGGKDALANGERRSLNGMALLASIAQDELQRQGKARDLVKLALNASSLPSVRIQPLASFAKPQNPPRKGFVPHEGGKLKREEDEQWEESAMRGSLHLVDEVVGEVATIKAEGNGCARGSLTSSAAAAVFSSSSESDLTDLSDEEGTGGKRGPDVPASSRKRIKLVHRSDEATASPAHQLLSRDEIESLLAVRELMKKKGEGELMKFLMSD